MKKYLTRFLLLVVAATCMWACASEKKEEPKQAEEQKDDNKNALDNGEIARANVAAPASAAFDLAEMDKEVAFAAYISVDDIVKKSGLTENQRKLIATQAIAEIEYAYLQEYVRKAIVDLDESGIKFSKPIYATCTIGHIDNEEVFECVVVAEVSNANTLDELLSWAGAPVEERNGVRYINEYCDGAYVTMGYNYSNLVFAITNNNAKDASYELFESTLNNAKLDLSLFGDRDIALYINGGELVDFAKKNYQNSIEEYKQMYHECRENGYKYDAEFAMEQVMECEDELANLNTFIDMYGDNIKSILGLTFENGRIVLDARYEGVKSEYDVWNTIDNAHLKYIPYNAFGFANIGLNGPNFVASLKEVMTPEMKQMICESFGIDANWLPAVYDALESINGDVTVALNYYNEEESFEYDYYWDEYYPTTVYDIEGFAMANTTNPYIYENLALMWPDLKKSANGYYMEAEDQRLDIGQIDNRLYLGLNTSCNNAISKSLESKWANRLDNSIAYIAVDIQNILTSPLGKKFMDELRNSYSYKDYEKIKSGVNMLDGAWLSVGNNNSAELVLALTDSETNALAQIINFVISNRTN